jgi:hypothetical protein
LTSMEAHNLSAGDEACGDMRAHGLLHF